MQDSPKTRYSLIGKLHDPQNLEAWTEFASIYQPMIFRIYRHRVSRWQSKESTSRKALTN